MILNILIFPFQYGQGSERNIKRKAIKFLRTEIIARADKTLDEKPITITAFKCDRSSGKIHDFYSEGDYWWPDPENPDGPYIQQIGRAHV